MTENFDYRFSGEEELDTPALVFYEDIIEENIKKTVAAAGAERLWPHVKTYKTGAVVKMLQAHGVKRFKCATIAEAEMCARCGAEHILVSYPLAGTAIKRFIELQRHYAASLFWAIGDDLEQLFLLGKAAAESGLCVPFLVDVNSGMNRTGVAFEQLADFCIQAGKIQGLALKGLHCYDGHLGIKDRAEREKAVAEETEKLNAVQKETESQGQELSIMVLGGTPTFPFHARSKNAFLSPGTLVIQDHGYDAKYKDLIFTPGAAILARVISRPKEGFFTIDLGYKGVSPDHEERGIIADLIEAEPVSQSEEHWVFQTKNSRPPIGTLLHVIPAHICPTSALYPGVHVVREKKLVNYWTIDARNRKITI